MVPSTGLEPASSFTAPGLEDQTGTRACLECGQQTSNPKFCCRSCATIYNNRVPKRKRTKSCPCGTKITQRYKYCSLFCRSTYGERHNWEATTLAEARKKGNANRGGAYPYIRSLARRSYLRSGRPLACAICHYRKHVDICHIRDIKAFPPDTATAIINLPSNLIALCKNHHWELDHGALC